MNIPDLLYGMLAGLITLIVLLLATAVVLLVQVLTKHTPQNKATPAPVLTKHPRLDIHA